MQSHSTFATSDNHITYSNKILES